MGKKGRSVGNDDRKVDWEGSADLYTYVYSLLPHDLLEGTRQFENELLCPQPVRFFPRNPDCTEVLCKLLIPQHKPSMLTNAGPAFQR